MEKEFIRLFIEALKNKDTVQSQYYLKQALKHKLSNKI